MTRTKLLPLVLLAAACGNEPDESRARHEELVSKAEALHGHANDARYGGAMLEIGEHAAWIEMVHDAGSGRLTLYFWDAHVENALRLDGDAIEVRIGETRLRLAPVADELTGERAGDTSRFEIVDPRLEATGGLRGEIGPLRLRGADYPATAFTLPPATAGK
jgi:hypothetical protein